MEFSHKKAKHLQKLLMAVCVGIASTQATATILNDQKELGWASFRDLTSSQFSQRFSEYKSKGYMLIDVDGYSTSSGLRYSMVWQENADKRPWAEHRNLTSSEYSTKWTEYKNLGYRPLDIAAYPSGSTTLYAGIWVKNTEGINWSSHRNLTSDQYGSLYTEKRAAGYKLVDMEAYTTEAGLRYSAIWYENKDKSDWIQYRNMSRDSYQTKVDELGAEGYTLVDFESYQNGARTQYAAIWEKKPGYASQVRTDRTETAFANLWRQYRDEGYRLVDFEHYSTPEGDRYGGVWIENNARFRYREKAQIDSVVQNYLEANDLPGISVSVMQNGQSLYRRGFGYADLENGKWAHSETIYNAASVSKVIGGTLAAKLEQNLQLRNGASFSLDLSDPTRNYVAGLPSQHTHTIEQLLSHTGCIGHYDTTPAIANQVVHYVNAFDAVKSIEDFGLVDGCTPGNKGSYSTPGFTFVAAALEGATGSSINNLLNTELFSAHDLQGMRVQFAGKNLVADYERAVPYRSDNSPTTYKDNSWKVLGGGIETSAYELTRFGAKLLNGEIVTPDTRDKRLWAQVNSRTTYGLGWLRSSHGGKSTVSHSGSWTGANSYIRIYRFNGVVISVMSNRADHEVGDLSSLTSQIADVVFNN